MDEMKKCFEALCDQFLPATAATLFPDDDIGSAAGRCEPIVRRVVSSWIKTLFLVAEDNGNVFNEIHINPYMLPYGVSRRILQKGCDSAGIDIEQGLQILTRVSVGLGNYRRLPQAARDAMKLNGISLIVHEVRSERRRRYASDPARMRGGRYVWRSRKMLMGSFDHSYIAHAKAGNAKIVITKETVDTLRFSRFSVGPTLVALRDTGTFPGRGRSAGVKFLEAYLKEKRITFNMIILPRNE